MRQFTDGRWSIGAALIAATVLSACTTTPEAETKIAVPELKQTCHPLASLQKNVIPAVTKSGFYITSIETPDEYYTDPVTGETQIIKTPDIENKVPYTKTVKEEQIYYTKPDDGSFVTDICELGTVEIPAELRPENDLTVPPPMPDGPGM